MPNTSEESFKTLSFLSTKPQSSPANVFQHFAASPHILYPGCLRQLVASTPNRHQLRRFFHRLLLRRFRSFCSSILRCLGVVEKDIIHNGYQLTLG